MSAATEHYKRAVSRWAEQRHDAGIAEFKTALDLQPDFRQAQFHLGYSYVLMNRYDEALQEFQTLIQADPSDAVACDYLGKRFVQKAGATGRRDDWSSAKDAYRQWLALVPDNADALDQLAVVSLKLGEFGEAAAFSHQAVRLAPKTDKSLTMKAPLSDISCIITFYGGIGKKHGGSGTRPS